MKVFFSVLVLLIIVLLPVKGYSFDRKTLLFVSEVESTNIQVLELKPWGELTTTGQTIIAGYKVAINPDQQYLWSLFYDTTSYGLKQYSVTSFGGINTTGRTIPITLGNSISDLEFTPNGNMLIIAGNPPLPIFRTFPDGSVVSTSNTYSAGLYISPRGDINAVRINNYRRVDKIDYNTFSVYSLQQFPATGGTIMDGAVYTPDGNYIAMAVGGGTNVNVSFEVYPVLLDGTLDTTHVQIFFTGGNTGYLDINPTGTHIYIGYDPPSGSPGILRFDWYSQDTPFINTGIRTLISDPWHIKVSPDGNILVVVSQDNSSFPSKQYLRTFFIQGDGSLVDTGYSFPFTDTFGDDIDLSSDLEFAWPPAPTSIPPELWRDPPPDTERHSSQEIMKSQ